MSRTKSFVTTDPTIKYITELSVRAHPLEIKLAEATHSNTGRSALLLGAPEVLHLGKNLIQLIGAKRVLDIGTFTGASALSWAIPTVEEGKIVSFDVSHDHFNKIGRPIIESAPELFKKIEFRLEPALDALDALIVGVEDATFDFAFIDADKSNYTNYYERCVQLIRPGGVIMVDNALWHRTVVTQPVDEEGRDIDKMNRVIAADERTNSSLLLIVDGIHLAFKK